MRIKLNNNDDKNLIRQNKKILNLKKQISKNKEKIKVEKESIKKTKWKKFKKSKVGRFLGKFGSNFNFDKERYSGTSVIIMVLMSFFIGVLVCFTVFVYIFKGRNYFVLSRDLNKLVEVYDTIVDNYYDEVDKEKLIDEAIDSMVSSVGDVYTNYVDSDTTTSFDELVGGTYEGIGCTIQKKENGIEVVSVFENSPSFKAGLLQGDVIKSVDGINVSGMTVDELSTYIKTQGDGKIKLIVIRDDKEKEINLVRSEVETPVVSSSIYERNGRKIGYLSISIFSSVAAKQFKQKLSELEKEDISSLIIDVRNNNGGVLTTVTDIVSEILPKGEIIYQVERNNKKEITKDNTVMSKSYPVAVLVNKASASAAEILASAIKESYNGYVVGTTTYGKGTVQQTKKLSDGSMIKYTVENWLTPDGNWIDGVGVEPTHIVGLNKEYYYNPSTETDNQLQKALELVSN